MTVDFFPESETKEATDSDQEEKYDPFDFMKIAASHTNARGPLYFDFETVPGLDSEELLDDDVDREPTTYVDVKKVVSGTVYTIDLHLSQLPYNDETLKFLDDLEREESTGKNRTGVLEKTKAFHKSIESYDESRRKKMSVTPELCRIVAIGWAIGDSPVHAILTPTAFDEAKAIVEFWKLIRAFSPVIGFNILNFDLPVLFLRSMKLSIKSTKKFDMRPWGTDVVDLMKKRFPGGQATGLKTLAKYHRFEVPAGDVDGSQVAELMESNPELVKKYVASDVEITRDLHREYKGFFC